MYKRIVLTTIIVCASIFSIGAQTSKKSDTTDAKQMQKLSRVYAYLNKLYVEDVDMSPIVESAIKGMLLELDPHSAYLDAEEMRVSNENFSGSFSGIGVEFSILNDTLIVVNTIAGAPAESVGILPNDKIVKIDTLDAVGIKQNDVPKYLRGKKHSKVNLEVVRDGLSTPLLFTVVRDDIPINTVDAAYMAAEKIGYIKVNRFGRTTMKEFEEAYRKLKPLDGLILDLRGNGGGLLDQAIKMSEFFLPKDAIIVSTQGRAIPTSAYHTKQKGEFTKGRVVVLLNEASASASEIVAGAIQDWDRGVIIGRPSFGKGLVQRQIPLGDGSAMRLTIAKYHTPSGRAIQRPYTKGDRDGYYKRIHERMNSESIDTTSHNGEVHKTLLSGRTVFGGGGITPDVLIEVDTVGVTQYLLQLVGRGVVNEFTIIQLDKHRDSLTMLYPTFEKFNDNFKITDQTIEELSKFGEQRGVEINPEQIAESSDILRRNLKAILAQKLFDVSAFYEVINNSRDKIYKMAVEIINNESKYSAIIKKLEK